MNAPKEYDAEAGICFGFCIRKDMKEKQKIC